MASLARTLRPYLRFIRSQRRSYADAAISEQMKFTFAGANQVRNRACIIRFYNLVSFFFRLSSSLLLFLLFSSFYLPPLQSSFFDDFLFLIRIRYSIQDIIIYAFTFECEHLIMAHFSSQLLLGVLWSSCDPPGRCALVLGFLRYFTKACTYAGSAETWSSHDLRRRGHGQKDLCLVRNSHHKRRQQCAGSKLGFFFKSYPVRDFNSTVHRFLRRRPIRLKILIVPQRKKFLAKPSNNSLQRQQIRIKPKQLSPLKSERLSCKLRNK